VTIRAKEFILVPVVGALIAEYLITFMPEAVPHTLSVVLTAPPAEIAAHLVTGTAIFYLAAAAVTASILALFLLPFFVFMVSFRWIIQGGYFFLPVTVVISMYVVYLWWQFYARRNAAIASERFENRALGWDLAGDFAAWGETHRGCLVGIVTFFGWFFADGCVAVLVGTVLHFRSGWAAANTILVAALVWIGCLIIDLTVSVLSERSAQRAPTEC